jgi:DNA-binding response OmpR family regulator
MKTRSIPDSLRAGGFAWVRASVLGTSGPRSPNAAQDGILLVSDDASLGENLRGASARAGRAVVHVDKAADALRALRAGQPAVVLLDLDLAAQAAWEAADPLLQEESCPPLVLLTALSDQFDVGTAIRAGLLVDKTAGPNRPLEAVDQILAGPSSAQAERNAIQRVMIRWLRPCNRSTPFTPAYRFHGINE